MGEKISAGTKYLGTKFQLASLAFCLVLISLEAW